MFEHGGVAKRRVVRPERPLLAVDRGLLERNMRLQLDQNSLLSLAQEEIKVS